MTCHQIPTIFAYSLVVSVWGPDQLQLMLVWYTIVWHRRTIRLREEAKEILGEFWWKREALPDPRSNPRKQKGKRRAAKGGWEPSKPRQNFVRLDTAQARLMRVRETGLREHRVRWAGDKNKARAQYRDRHWANEGVWRRRSVWHLWHLVHSKTRF